MDALFDAIGNLLYLAVRWTYLAIKGIVLGVMWLYRYYRDRNKPPRLPPKGP